MTLLKLDGLLASHGENEQQTEKHIMTNKEDFSKQNYVDHEDKLHGEKSPVVFNNSNEQFLNQVESNVEDWIGRLIKCESEKYSCSFTNCGKQFKFLSHMKRHADKHVEGNSFKCEKCGVMKSTRNSLHIHMT